MAAAAFEKDDAACGIALGIVECAGKLIERLLGERVVFGWPGEGYGEELRSPLDFQSRFRRHD
jgi:hypothetical protein